MIYHFFPDHEDAYPPEHEHIEDEQAQADDQRQLQERLAYILRDALTRPLTEDEVKWLCTGCGIDIRTVT